MQTSYSLNMDRGYAGMKVDMRDDTVESYVAYDEIGVGLAVVKQIGVDNAVRLPRGNRGTITFGGDLITDNVVNSSVNGVSAAAVTFATDHATTMAALAAAIQALAIVKTAAVTAARVITVTLEDGYTISALLATVTLGVSQTTATYAYTTIDDFSTMQAGIALHSHTIEQEDDGTVSYKATEVVNVLRKGIAYMVCEEAVSADDSVYVRYKAGTGTVIGAVRNDSDSSTCLAWANARFKETTTVAGIVAVEINLP